MTNPVGSSPVPQSVPLTLSSFTGGKLSPEEKLLSLIVFSQVNQANCAEASINLSYEDLARIQQEAREALQQAREAQEDSGFWGAICDLFGSDIASIAAVVAAAAAVVATGGAAAAIVAAVAAAASIAAQHAEELGIPTEVAMVIAVVAAVASLCCGNASGLFKVGETVKTVATGVQSMATAVNGLSTAVGGGARVVKGSYDKDVLDARADARAADGQAHLENVQIDEAIQMLSDALELKQNTTQGFANMLEASNQSENAVLFTMAGVA